MSGSGPGGARQYGGGAEGLHAASEGARAAQRRACGEARAQRRATMLKGLEDGLFGSRMPDPIALVAACGWKRDRLDRFCGRCGVTLVPFEDKVGGCVACRRRRLPHGAFIRLGRYAPPLSQWVPAVKRRAWIRMADHLGRELGEQARDAVDAGLLAPPAAVVFVPLHWVRRLLRGIDHSRRIATAVAKQLGVPCVPALRARLAVRQTGGTRGHRLGQEGRFAATSAAAGLRGKAVLLVDDVRTTGGTLAEAVSALRLSGVAEVFVACVAATDPPGRRAPPESVRERAADGAPG